MPLYEGAMGRLPPCEDRDLPLLPFSRDGRDEGCPFATAPRLGVCPEGAAILGIGSVRPGWAVPAVFTRMDLESRETLRELVDRPSVEGALCLLVSALGVFFATETVDAGLLLFLELSVVGPGTGGTISVVFAFRSCRSISCCFFRIKSSLSFCVIKRSLSCTLFSTSSDFFSNFIGSCCLVAASFKIWSKLRAASGGGPLSLVSFFGVTSFPQPGCLLLLFCLDLWTTTDALLEWPFWWPEDSCCRISCKASFTLFYSLNH